MPLTESMLHLVFAPIIANAFLDCLFERKKNTRVRSGDFDLEHMREACMFELSKFVSDRSVTFSKSRGLQNFKPHLLCVAISV